MNLPKKIKRRRKPVALTIAEVAAIVGLSEQRIRQLEREGRFPKRLSEVGRPRWSKLRVYHWYRRWGVPSTRNPKHE